MISSRRSFITGLVSLVTAPVIVRASSLMPVKPVKPVWVVTAGGLSTGMDVLYDAMTLAQYQWTPDELRVLRMRPLIAVNRLPTFERMTS